MRKVHTLNLIPVKTHSGIEGNEVVDLLGNQARAQGELTTLPMKKNFARQAVANS